MSNDLIQLEFLFDNNGQLLTREQMGICEEWSSGKAIENMKISGKDPRLLDYVGYFERLENKKDYIWDRINNSKA